MRGDGLRGGDHRLVPLLEGAFNGAGVNTLEGNLVGVLGTRQCIVLAVVLRHVLGLGGPASRVYTLRGDFLPSPYLLQGG